MIFFGDNDEKNSSLGVLYCRAFYKDRGNQPDFIMENRNRS